MEDCFGAAEAPICPNAGKEVEADRLRFAIQGREATVRGAGVLHCGAEKQHPAHNLENTARIREELEQREGRQDSLSGQIAGGAPG